MFLNCPHRETPRNVINKIEKNRFWIFCRFVCKNVFCSVYELPSLRNTEKHDKTKTIEEKLTSNFCRFFWEKFSTWTWTFCKNTSVFLNSPCRNLPLTEKSQERTKNKSRKKLGRWVGLGFGISAGGGDEMHFCLPAPRREPRRAWQMAVARRHHRPYRA